MISVRGQNNESTKSVRYNYEDEVLEMRLVGLVVSFYFSKFQTHYARSPSVFQKKDCLSITPSH